MKLEKIKKMIKEMVKMSKALTLTIVANMTSNYSEGLGNSKCTKSFSAGKGFCDKKQRES